MTTTLRKTFRHKKARAISSGFLKLINTFMLTPRQGIAGKQTPFTSMAKHHESDNSTSAGNLASIQAQKSTLVWFLTHSQAGVM